MHRFRFLCVAFALCAALPLAGLARADAATRLLPPLTRIDGLARGGAVDAAARLHIAIELEPKDPALDTLALAVADPASPMHRSTLARDAFVARFGRAQAEIDTLTAFLRNAGAANVYASGNRLVVGGDLSVQQAERAFHTTYATFANKERVAIAPLAPLTVPVDHVRAIRGAVTGVSPRLAQVTTPVTDFRGDWFLPLFFRDAYEAVDAGGAGARIVAIEDASDRHDPRDIAQFLSADGAPSGADAARVRTQVSVDKAAANAVCGRDDRGQEATLDISALLTLAPQATIEVRYDDICAPGDEGVVALSRALDDPNPISALLFPFAIGPVYTTVAQTYGKTPIPYLEAAVRGIPLIVPSGDDGAYGMHLAGIERPAVTFPCVLPTVICAGGTELGDRSGRVDEAPWNDGVHAAGGGISNEPRPAWQEAPGLFEFSRANVPTRIVPDLSADAAGHLRIFWRGYASGGVGGTSEGAAFVAAQIAAINAAVPPAKRLLFAGDLYALAQAQPAAFRPITRENSRAYNDNTLRPKPLPLPLDYRGPLPSPPPTVKGCDRVQPSGCAVTGRGFNALAGLGTLKGRTAVGALQH